MEMTFKEACSAVADLFEAVPELWIAGDFAQDDFGTAVDWCDPPAVCWCAIGAVNAALGYGPHDTVGKRLRPFARKIQPNSNASYVNDKGGRLVAIKMLRMAAGEIKCN